MSKIKASSVSFDEGLVFQDGTLNIESSMAEGTEQQKVIYFHKVSNPICESPTLMA
jgi:hypothetical protein